VKRAGLQSGTFRWLRRSAGSYAESVQRGNGAAALGHRSEGVFRTHYDDPSISKPTPIIVPALKRPAVG